MNLEKFRITSDNKLAGSIRLLLAIIFLMAGTMKLFVPLLADAWSGQLLAASLPFYTLTLWTVPVIEIVLGAVLAAGLLARPAVIAVMGLMVVASYVHMVVDDPSLFPLQPSEPIIPVVVIVLSVYILWRGAGSWSLDLKASQALSKMSLQ